MSTADDAKRVAQDIAGRVFFGAGSDRTEIERKNLESYLEGAFTIGHEQAISEESTERVGAKLRIQELEREVEYLKTKPVCHPQVLRALRAELHQTRGGHLPEVQADVGKLGTVPARVILTAMRDLRSRNNRMRSQPWRRF
jgi:hypothetical protein